MALPLEIENCVGKKPGLLWGRPGFRLWGLGAALRGTAPSLPTPTPACCFIKCGQPCPERI